MIITHGKEAKKILDRYGVNGKYMDEDKPRKPHALSKAAQVRMKRKQGLSWRTISFSLGIAPKTAKKLYEDA